VAKYIIYPQLNGYVHLHLLDGKGRPYFRYASLPL